jgi:putative DNA primase/helicase
VQFQAPYTLVPAGNLALHFHPEHLADLRASGLSDETIKAANIFSVAPRLICSRDPRKALHGGPFFSSRGVPPELRSALCFPYGAEFARIKLFPPGPYESSPNLGKIKYKQPPGTSARLYMPFAIGNGPLFVVEGEKKCLAGYQAGLNSVGIGGLWNWLSNGAPVDDLKLIEWDGREVTIIPDSDVFDRPDLLRAVYALGRELQSQGASVYVAEIPQTGATKVGLDDFLVSGGKVGALELFSLSHRVFKACGYWHGRWRFQKVVQAAA